MAYTLPVFLSAFLLFQVQLIVSKHILPWFGGAPAVWSASMMLFQALLLGGYAYAHALTRRVPQRRQGIVHICVLGAAVLVVFVNWLHFGSPILADASWRPNPNADPTWQVIVLLIVSVGVPFFVLSATGPLLQAWFAAHRPGISPYWLYALSNLGSLLGLVSYPAVFEPLLRLRVQAAVWGGGFVVFVIACVWCAWRIPRLYEGMEQTSPISGADQIDDEEGPPGLLQRFLWLSLAAAASVVLLANTNQICQDVGVFPFLWVAPLVAYLLSFVVCFQYEWVYKRGIFLPLFAIAIGVACQMLFSGIAVPAAGQIGGYTFIVFICAMVCHGELVRIKPNPRYLTSFYLLIATGGAIGGLFVALVAPRIFRGFWEFHAGLLACCVLVFGALLVDRESWLNRGRIWPALVACLGAFGLFSTLLLRGADGKLPFAVVQEWLRAPYNVMLAVVLAISLLWFGRRALVFRYWRGRPFLATVLLGVALMMVSMVFRTHILAAEAGGVWSGRDFFGVLQVQQIDQGDPGLERYELHHGRIIHGFQFTAADKRELPTTYYCENSGIARLILSHPRRSAVNIGERSLRIGIVGLGVGTLATYGDASDTFRHYEIHPAVIELAKGAGGYYTFLKDSAAKQEIVLGDARLSMERELARGEKQQFDILVMDAFNSGAVPVHLLTTEALAVYLAHLKWEGVLAVDASNRNIDIVSLTVRLAESASLQWTVIETEQSREGSCWHSTWVLMSRDEAILMIPDIANGAKKNFNPSPSSGVWTDDYSSLLPLLRRRGVK